MELYGITIPENTADVRPGIFTRDPMLRFPGFNLPRLGTWQDVVGA